MLVAGLTPLPVAGQTGTPIDQNRVDRTGPTGTVPGVGASRPQAPGGATRIEVDPTAVPITSIRFDGVSVPSVVARAAEAFIGRPADAPTLQALVGAMSAAYDKSPVALYTLIIPQQDLKSGVVHVAVGEGYISNVVLTGEVDGHKMRLIKAYAERLTEEKPTRRAVMERYLSLIGDIPGVKATPELRFGQQPGSVVLVLKLDHMRPTLTASFDNRTTQLTRDGQFSAKGTAYRLLTDGDQLVVNGAASVDFREQLYAGLSYAAPIGTDGLRLSLSAGYLSTRPRRSPIAGEAETGGLELSYPLIRGYRRNLYLTAAVDGVNSRNAAFGSIVANERSRAARLALGFSNVGQRRVLSAGLTVSHGLDVLDARTDPSLAEAGFLKANARANLDQAIGRQAALRLRTAAQWSGDRLPAVERFSVGGSDFGRAFEAGLISADRGASGLAEFAWRPLSKGDFAASELYTFADYSAIGFTSRPLLLKRHYDLGSAGAGVRFAWGRKAWLEVEGARVIDQPYEGYDGKWRLSVAWRISFRS